MQSCDAIIIGGGVNGLACAARLQMAGRRVIVLERAGAAGGAMRGAPFAPGFASPGLAHLAHGLDPRVVQEMGLDRHGLRYVTGAVATTALSARGDHLVLQGAFGATLHGGADAGWPALRARLLAFAGVLAPFRAMAPPRLARGVGNDTLRLARLGLGVRALGKTDFRELLRVLLTNVADVLEDELTDDRLKGLLGFDATRGAWLGPQSPNSLILLLNWLSMAGGALALPVGGMGAVADAMARAAQAQGVVIRTGADVTRLIVEGDQAVGVVLADGTEMRAPTIVSAISPKVTFLQLVGPRHLDTGFVRRIAAMKSRGAAAKLHLALSRAPDFRGADLASRLVIAPSLRAVENAFNAVKYGAVPVAPVMEIMLPSVHEAGHAPDGQHLLSAIVQSAPHDPRAGQDAARAAMLEATLAQLEAHAPGLRASILHSEILMPYDIDARYGMTGGNWHHGELSVEQMFFLRPVPGMAQYATPLAGLWLAGAGGHPGGGVTGTAGWNAATRIIERVRG